MDGDVPRGRAEGSAVAGPPEIRRTAAEPGLDRVERHVSENLPELLVRLLANRLVAPVEQVTEQVVAIVEIPAVLAVQPLHACWQVWLWRFDDQMNVVPHEAIRQQMPPNPRDDLAEKPQILRMVSVIAVDA